MQLGTDEKQDLESLGWFAWNCSSEKYFDSVSFTPFYIVLKFLKYLQCYRNSSKELLWHSIRSHCSLISQSVIFSGGSCHSDRITGLGTHTLFFSFLGHQCTDLFLKSSPAPASPLLQGWPAQLGSKGPGWSILALTRPWHSALLLLEQEPLFPGYSVESGQQQLQCLLCLFLKIKC